METHARASATLRRLAMGTAAAWMESASASTVGLGWSVTNASCTSLVSPAKTNAAARKLVMEVVGVLPMEAVSVMKGSPATSAIFAFLEGLGIAATLSVTRSRRVQRMVGVSLKEAASAMRGTGARHAKNARLASLERTARLNAVQAQRARAMAVVRRTVHAFVTRAFQDSLVTHVLRTCTARRAVTTVHGTRPATGMEDAFRTEDANAETDSWGISARRAAKACTGRSAPKPALGTGHAQEMGIASSTALVSARKDSQARLVQCATSFIMGKTALSFAMTKHVENMVIVPTTEHASVGMGMQENSVTSVPNLDTAKTAKRCVTGTQLAVATVVAHSMGPASARRKPWAPRATFAQLTSMAMNVKRSVTGIPLAPDTVAASEMEPVSATVDSP
eukprot:1728754-Rhodomonas_salina.1